MSENIVQICFFGGTDEAFEQVSGIILATDIPAKLTHIKTSPKLIDVIEKNKCQLILGNTKQSGFDVFNVIALIQEMKKPIPVIGLFKNPAISVTEAMLKGLNDYVDASNLQHLQLVILRELKYLQLDGDSSSFKTISNKDFTGLNSRLQFLEYLDNELEARISRSDHTAILYLQLDNFAWINESIGIIFGDIFLKDIATVIGNLLENADLAARYQGGSFILLVEASSLKKLSAKADMIRESVGEAITDIEDNTISSSCSIGIRLIHDSSESHQQMISDAYDASEIAKTNGGDSVHLHKDHDEISVAINEKHAWDSRIREAFENDLFQLFFQPIVSLQGDTKPRYEVLLRMIDEDGNIIAPGTFLPFAERAGLMADIDRRVISYSLEKALEEKNKGNRTEIFIKLSGKSLDDKTLPGWISTAIKEVDIANEDIVFEITESLALTHLTQTRRMISSLKKLGCKIAIDHFGTRVKSLKLLDLISMDYLKVDGSLLGNIQTKQAHQTIVKKICRAAKEKNIQIMAESVQDVNNLPVIWQYGFQFVQGYFLQIPDDQMEYDFSNLLI